MTAPTINQQSPLTVRAGSKIFVWVRLTASVVLGSQDVYLAFLEDELGDLEPVDEWEEAEWYDDEENGTSRWCRILVGPATNEDVAFTLERGKRYRVWWKVIDNPEEPIGYAGMVYAP